MARSTSAPTSNLASLVPPVIRNYWRAATGHRNFLRDIARIRDILQEYLLDDDLRVGDLRENYVVDLSTVADDVRNHLSVQEAVEHIEFRENQLCEILDLLIQLEGTVPRDVMYQLTR